MKGDKTMEETIKLILDEVNSNLKEMKGLSKSSDEYGNIVSDTSKLLDKVTPMIKIKDEADERAKNRKEDLAIQEKIRKEEADERARIREDELKYKEQVRQEENELKEKIRKEEADERAKIREEDRKEREEIREDELKYKEQVRQEEAYERARNREEDREERKINREEDNAFKIESEKKNLFIEGVKIAVPVATTVLLLLNDNKLGNKLLKFEETGTLTTTIGRNFFSSIGRKKK